MKILWVIDGSYLMANRDVKIDYLKLKQLLEKQMAHPITETHFFDNYDVRGEGFYNWLRMAKGPKMQVHLYDLKPKKKQFTCELCGERQELLYQEQKGVDVGICSFILKKGYGGDFDRLILSAGDSDFTDCLAVVKNDLKKEVWLVGFEETTGAELQAFTDHVVWLELYIPEIQRALI